MADSEILERLRQYDIYPNERLGQHILIDPAWLDYIASHADSSSHVIEIGAGPGNLTERIATRANSVTAIELDYQYERILSDLSQQHTNLSVVFGDALSVDYEALQPDKYQELQVIANPPYHIAEPLMGILTTLPIQDAILMVGDKLSATLCETDPRRSDFTRLSLLAMGFFEVVLLASVPKSAFYPQPRTNSHIISLTPKDDTESASPAIHIIQQLFLLAHQSAVGNIIQRALQERASGHALQSKEDRNRHERRKTKRWLNAIKQNYDISKDQEQKSLIYSNPLTRLKIPERILSSRFLSLNNSDLQTLTKVVLEAYPDQ